jgi:hypothetical protein
VTNIFLSDFQIRLKFWVELRESLANKQDLDRHVAIDKFWQKVPIQQNYLHTDFIKDWPDPWQLLSDNTYCYYARALGMIYTLLLLDTKNIELVEAVDDNSNEVVLVLVENKYVLNYWPNSVLSNKISDFTITRRISIEALESKIG